MKYQTLDSIRNVLVIEQPNQVSVEVMTVEVNLHVKVRDGKEDPRVERGPRDISLDRGPGQGKTVLRISIGSTVTSDPSRFFTPLVKVIAEGLSSCLFCLKTRLGLLFWGRKRRTKKYWSQSKSDKTRL